MSRPGRLWEHSRGPKYAKCPACSDLLRKEPGLAWFALETTVWLASGIIFLGPLNVSDATAVVLVVAIRVPWIIANQRLYRAFWMWRHPLRCETGGHAEPERGSA